MKVIALLQEFPLPANNGMRTDIFRRLKGMSALGWQVHAVAWTGGRLDPHITPAQRETVRGLVSSLEILPIDRSMRRIANLVRWPSQGAGRWPSSNKRRKLITRFASDPEGIDAVWIDGIHAAPLGRWLARELGIPYFFRSHNIEHRYTAEQARLAKGRDKLSIAANLIGLRRFEWSVLRDAKAFFDISFDDLEQWRRRGLANGKLLLPLADQDLLNAANKPPSKTLPSDIAFTGSLSSPNNVAAIRWYLNEVHRYVTEQLPDADLLVAGRNPSAELAHDITAAGGRLVADPADMEPILFGAHVTMNPIWHGSGVNIKMIDMLASGRPVVSTSKGIRGLPPEIVEQISVADSPRGFAKALIAHIQRQRALSAATDRMAVISRYFGADALKTCISQVEATLD